MADIELTLFAPYNEEAVVLGDFSDWEAVPMDKGEDGVFRIRLELEDGSYRYRFRVRSKSWFYEADSWVEVVDPYAGEVEDSAEGAGILRVSGGERILDAYRWQHDDKPLPADHQLVIYELHVGDFSGGDGDAGSSGSFRDVIAKLDYLQDLGVNALELLPLAEYPGGHSWGYNPRHFFAPESSYGKPEDLKELVDRCHERGIRVLLDVVFNHAESSSPLTQIDHDYWFHHEPRDPENNWGPEFNYEGYDETLDTFPARRFAGDALRYWAGTFHLDGYRFDAARQLGNFDFLRWVVQEAKQTAGAKPFYAVAEYIPEDPAVSSRDGPVDGCWHESFYHVVTEVLTGNARDFERLKDALDGRRRGFLAPSNLVNYLSSHDHDHLLGVLGEAGVLGEEAFRRARLGFTLLFTAFGLPMVWMGDEYGEPTPSQTEPSKLNWSLLSHDDNRGLHAFVRSLIHLRTAHGALQGAELEFFHEDAERGVLAFQRWHENGGRVVVIANLAGEFLGNYPLSGLPADGVWHEWTRDYDVQVEGGQLSLDLGPFEAQVFVK